jgi:F0F1-type ATP synthase membrane subunit b/b'
MPVIMDSLSIASAAAGLALVMLTWLVARWWYRRQVVQWTGRFRKCEGKLDAAEQQSSQARRQIEKLQRELSEARRAAAVASSQLGSQRTRAVVPAATPPAPSKVTHGSGFADTMPL